MHQAGLFKAIHYFGSQHALAAAVGVRQQAVGHWLNREQKIPYLRAACIVALSEGYIGFDELIADHKATQKILDQAFFYNNFPAILLPIQDISIDHACCSLYKNKEHLFDNPAHFAKAQPILVDKNYRLITCICRLRAHQQARHKKILVHPLVCKK